LDKTLIRFVFLLSPEVR